MKKFDKILIRGPDTVGSFVLATPFFKAVKKNNPNSYINLCVKPLVYSLAKRLSFVDFVTVYEKDLVNKINLIKKIRKDKYDVCFLLSGSLESALFAYMCNISKRVGYAHDHRGFLLTDPVVENEKKHYVDYLLYLLENFNYDISDKTLELCNNKHYNDNGPIIYGDKSKIIGLSFTVAGESARNWPKEYAVELIKKFVNNNFVVFLFGIDKKNNYSNFIDNNIRHKNFHNLIGKTSIDEFIDLISKCDLFISVASGGLHIACAFGVKVLGLFCPGDEIGWGPYSKNSFVISKNLPCAPCSQHKMKYCKDNKCMKLISLQEVYQKAIEMLSD